MVVYGLELDAEILVDFDWLFEGTIVEWFAVVAGVAVLAFVVCGCCA